MCFMEEICSLGPTTESQGIPEERNREPILSTLNLETLGKGCYELELISWQLLPLPLLLHRCHCHHSSDIGSKCMDLNANLRNHPGILAVACSSFFKQKIFLQLIPNQLPGSPTASSYRCSIIDGFSLSFYSFFPKTLAKLCRPPH